MNHRFLKAATAFSGRRKDDDNRAIHFTPIQFGLGIPANIYYVTATIVKHRKHRLRQAVRIAYEEQQLDDE